jgi:hypothetical protein
MKLLQDLAECETGSPQFRIQELTGTDAPLYFFYGQQEMENDLAGIELNRENPKTIRTSDRVSTVDAGDILFSLISGKTTVASFAHRGYLYTQNYVRLKPRKEIDGKYLVYLLNESDYVRKQLTMGLQGSAVLKHTVKQLREIELPELHSVEKQILIGNLYFEQLNLQALKTRAANAERTITVEKLKRVGLS